LLQTAILGCVPWGVSSAWSRDSGQPVPVLLDKPPRVLEKFNRVPVGRVAFEFDEVLFPGPSPVSGGTLVLVACSPVVQSRRIATRQNPLRHHLLVLGHQALVCRGDLHLWRRFEESDRDHRIDLSAQWEFELVRQTTDLPQELKWSSSLFRKLKAWAAGKVVASVQSQIGHISNFQGDETVLRVVDVFCCVRCEVNRNMSVQLTKFPNSCWYIILPIRRDYAQSGVGFASRHYLIRAAADW
jgi:hypothetical protein